MQTPVRLARFALAALVLAAGAACGDREPADEDPRLGGLSLLAVGDTGKPAEAIAALDPGRAVARALASEDERDPIEALVLLGDNFYPDGLEKDELKDRLRENLVGPYCRFIELTPRGAGSLREACPAADAVHPIPIFAILGNHDYGERESPELQRHVVPDYVRSWRMPEDDVGVRELRGGVSLILLDSNRVARTDGEEDDDVVRAIRDSAGPWRVIAAHHPMVRAGRGWDPRFAERMAEIVERAGVPIHLYLAGHEHNLQAFPAPGRSPALHLVAGGGSDTRKISDADPSRTFAQGSLGFARLDFARKPSPKLVATFLEVPAPPLPARPRAVAAFELTLEGDVKPLDVTPGVPESGISPRATQR
jgi:hypothetical protein